GECRGEEVAALRHGRGGTERGIGDSPRGLARRVAGRHPCRVLAHPARGALGGPVGEALGAGIVVVLVGERPGLSSADSLGLYLTHGPRPGRADSERNCISNVRPPHGLGYAQAADTLAALLQASRQLGASGVVLKDEGTTLPPGAG
ncbi:ethanolamine ammonia-lyase light chain EutC, partial [Modestobacter marinus]|uniref:ethanolamine ammonia-lyase light chain EutC n=1 Tax=Modestobacter marinus TaxID=477641 RepID=UPI00201ABF8B